MDNKRTILAVALSLLVLLAWNYIFVPIAPQQPEQGTTQSAPAARPEAQTKAPEAKPTADTPDDTRPQAAFIEGAGREINVRTPLYEARFNAAGGILENFVLSRYKASNAPDSPSVDLVSPEARAKAPMALIVNGQPSWREGKWTSDGQDIDLKDGKATLSFTGEAGGLKLVRELTFFADNYLIEENLKVRSATGQPVTGKLAFTLATRTLSPQGDTYNPTRIAYFAKGSLSTVTGEKDMKNGTMAGEAVSWGALESNYFLLSLVPLTEGTVFKAKLEDDIFRLAMEKDGQSFEPGADKTLTMDYYLGPKLDSYLAKAPNELSKAIDLGFFSFIARPLIQALKFFYSYVGNYGVAIIILTVIIKLLFWPLSQKSYKSMEQMKKLQPMMAKIREKHKDDREQMNVEIMNLYKTYKVNPAGGCLPMVVQIPVFFGLYQALLGAIELRHAPFIPTLPFTDMVWLADLSAKDPYYITPLIMGATMFLQQKMTPAPGDPTQAKVMLFMPIIFTFMFLNFPSGLVIYWLVNNILSISQQWWMMRKA